jgi:hypothetical protein
LRGIALLIGEQEMNRWQISFPISGLRDVIKEPGTELTIDKVKFYYRENERIGSIIVDSDHHSYAESEAKYQINRSLARICFAYNTEANLHDGHYAIDLTNKPEIEWVYVEQTHRWSYVKEDPFTTLSKIESLDSEKQEVLDLALAYYKLGEYANPLRIESFFSCMTVLVRNLLGKKEKGEVGTAQLKNKIKDVLKEINTSFNENQFEKDWKDSYSDERCSIAHGLGSKLIDIRTTSEHDKVVNMVGGWARQVVYYFIDKYKHKNE